MTTKYPTTEEVRQRLHRAQGERKQKDFAQELGISTAYLCDILQGKREPGTAVLNYLGLTRRVVYPPKPRPRKDSK